MTALRVGVTTFGCDGGRSGIGRYVLHLVRELASRHPEIRLEILAYEDETEGFQALGQELVVWGFSRRFRNSLLGLLWYQICLPLWCWRRGYDVLFLPEANRRLPAWVPCPTVGTVHDLSSIHMKGKYDPVREFYITRVLPSLIRRLTCVIADSNSTREDLIEHACVPASRIGVVPLGVDCDQYEPRDKSTCQARIGPRYGIRPPYLLYVSRIEHPGKNHATLIRAFEIAKLRYGLPHMLVLAGSDWNRADEVRRQAAASPNREDIRFTGFVADADLPDLYCGADVFVFPSLYEGFGMPILEAMASGVPVACSNVSSLPEVAGDAAELFSPNSPEQMAEILEALLTDESRRNTCVSRGLERVTNYTWQAAAERTADVIRTAVESGNRERERAEVSRT